jgi:hypothetical protein
MIVSFIKQQLFAFNASKMDSIQGIVSKGLLQGVAIVIVETPWQSRNRVFVKIILEKYKFLK